MGGTLGKLKDFLFFGIPTIADVDNQNDGKKSATSRFRKKKPRFKNLTIDM